MSKVYTLLLAFSAEIIEAFLVLNFSAMTLLLKAPKLLPSNSKSTPSLWRFNHLCEKFSLRFVGINSLLLSRLEVCGLVIASSIFLHHRLCLASSLCRLSKQKVFALLSWCNFYIGIRILLGISSLQKKAPFFFGSTCLIC